MITSSPENIKTKRAGLPCRSNFPTLGEKGTMVFASWPSFNADLMKLEQNIFWREKFKKDKIGKMRTTLSQRANEGQNFKLTPDYLTSAGGHTEAKRSIASNG
jgi:hypothetical protein